jgi:hypothetical protein
VLNIRDLEEHLESGLVSPSIEQLFIKYLYFNIKDILKNIKSNLIRALAVMSPFDRVIVPGPLVMPVVAVDTVVVVDSVVLAFLLAIVFNYFLIKNIKIL